MSAGYRHTLQAMRDEMARAKTRLAFENSEHLITHASYYVEYHCCILRYAKVSSLNRHVALQPHIRGNALWMWKSGRRHNLNSSNFVND